MRPTSLKYAVTTTPSHPDVITTLGNSTCSAKISPSERRVHSLVRPAPRAFFHPDRQISQPSRAGPVKSLPPRRRGLAAFSRPPERLGLDWPEHGGTLDRLGLEAARTCTGTARTLITPTRSTPANPATAHKRPQHRRRARAKKSGNSNRRL